MDMQPIIDGLQVAAIGFSVVMIALILLWGIMVAFSRFLGPEEYRNRIGTDRSGARDTGRTSDEQIHAEQRAEHMRRIAAISAAITETMATSGGADFRIVSVRPVRNPESEPWRLSGRKSRLQARPRSQS